MSKTTVTRYHDISTGHRVVGHECGCRHLHGHNYRIHFTCEAEDETLDSLGRVIDFSEVKKRLCYWVEDHWDHKFLAWKEDPLMKQVYYLSSNGMDSENFTMLEESIVWMDFNPTAENLAKHLVEVVGPEQLAGTGIKLVSVEVEETRKCSASYSTCVHGKFTKLING